MAHGASSTLVLDNGAFTAKIGIATATRPRIAPNCITKAKSERRRTFVGTQIDDCRDLSGLYFVYPHQRGYLVNWDVEKRIWLQLFASGDVTPTSHSFILTEPCFNFASIQESLNEIALEELQFKSFFRCPAPVLSAAAYHRRFPAAVAACVIDTGFSFTHVVPTYAGRPISAAVRRIDVGGKVLTNHLKDIVSYRQLNVMDETHVINQAKEDVCYVSLDVGADMAVARARDPRRNTIARDYVLPDFARTRRGYVRDISSGSATTNPDDQIIRFTNERFSVPELLFSPSDIGIRQCGIPEAIIHSIAATPEILHPHLYGNIVLTGGNAALPGFCERVYRDVRALVPAQYDVGVWLPPDPVTFAWEGGRALVASGEFERLRVTQRDAKEFGMGACQRRLRLEADLTFAQKK